MNKSGTLGLARLVKILVLPLRMLGRPLPLNRGRQHRLDTKRLSEHLKRDLGLSP